MGITALALRDDVYVNADPSRSLIQVGAALIQDHFSLLGRPLARHPKSEVVFNPKVIYRAYTGLSFNFAKAAPHVSVRASVEAWDQGALTVLRHDVDPESGELHVFFQVMREFPFRRRAALFEVWPSVVGSGEELAFHGTERSAGREASLPVFATVEPEGAHIDGSAAYRASLAQAETPDTASDEKKVQSWLETPDDRGGVAGTDSPHSRPVSETAQISPASTIGQDSLQPAPPPEEEAPRPVQQFDLGNL